MQMAGHHYCQHRHHSEHRNQCLRQQTESSHKVQKIIPACLQPKPEERKHDTSFQRGTDCGLSTHLETSLRVWGGAPVETIGPWSDAFETDAPMKVRPELVRHASIQTTMMSMDVRWQTQSVEPTAGWPGECRANACQIT